MRLTEYETEVIKQSIQNRDPKAFVYLFGSRADDNLKGGDIDVLVIADRQLTNQEKRNIKIAFYKEFGEQKIDLISFKHDDESSFKDYVLLESVGL